MAYRIPLIDLAAQQRVLGERLQDAVGRVLAHGRFVLGPEVSTLEAALADYLGVRHAIACSNGTDALLLGLMALGIGRGDVVFTTPFTFIATAEVIGRVGARPVFVDIERATFNIDPAALTQAVESAIRRGEGRPAAVITVDLFGLPCDYERIGEIAARHGLAVLEDAAQAFGARRHGRAAGTMADIGTTSFYPTKPLGGYGDGGAIFTDRDDLAARLRSLRAHGSGASEYDNLEFGLNARLDTLQAAMLLEKLAMFPRELDQRAAVAARYEAALSTVVEVPRIPAGTSSAWAQYSILTPERDELRAVLDAAGIGTGIYYPKPLHLQRAFASYGYREGTMPVAERCSREILSLPMHAYLVPAAQDEVIDVIDRFGKRARRHPAVI
jgi:UDP-2-acetamido-2-deoxy-ribo-hexuluronate aminotransferase